MRRKKGKIPVISLFTGSGGLDLGFARAGFEVRVAIESDPAACRTLLSNWPSHRSRLIQASLEDVSTTKLLEVADLEVGETGVVIGGPPCQSWCIAGNRLGLSDPRGRSILEFCRVVREAAPLAFCLENVPGFLNHQAHRVLELIEQEVNRHPKWKYTISAQVLNTAEYGIAQVRRRVFVVGWRSGGEFYFPAPTHHLSGTPKRPWKHEAVGVGTALRGLPKAAKPSKIARRVAETIQERNVTWYGKR